MFRLSLNSTGSHSLNTLILAGVFAITLSACSRQEEIRRYDASIEQTTGSVHDFGAMASKPAPTVGEQLAYDTPAGWEPGEVQGLRKAAFRVEDGDQQVEITAIDLSAAAAPLLPNVNRWRQQIQLGAITEEELEDAIGTIQVAGVEAHYVELVGPEDTESRQAILGVVVVRKEKAWFFKLWGDAELALREKDRFREFAESVIFEGTTGSGGSQAVAAGGDPPSATAGGGSSPLECKAPEGWTPGKTGGMRKAAFVVRDGDQEVEITAIDLFASSGALLPNVNRWRQQIQLGEITQEELEKEVVAIQVAGVEGQYVELLGPEDAERRLAILGVVAIHQDRAWFFKMAGDVELALREKERFEVFVESIDFAQEDGAESDD